MESDLDSIGVQWPGDRGFSQVEILFFLFYIYTIIFSKSEIAAKKIVAKYKHKPSRTLHGRKAGKKTVSRKNSLEKYKSQFSNKKSQIRIPIQITQNGRDLFRLELGFLGIIAI